MPDQTPDTTRTLWLLLVDDAERVRRFSMRRWSAWCATNHVQQDAAGEWQPVLVDPVPDCEGLTTLRYIEVGVDLLNRRPVSAFHLHCGLKYLDGHGRPDLEKDREHMQQVMTVMGDRIALEGIFTPKLAPDMAADRTRFRQRTIATNTARLAAEFRWTPSDAVWAQVRVILYGPTAVG